MSEFASPRAVFQRVIDGVTARCTEALPRLYAEDAVIVPPFAGDASRLEGREALREHFARLGSLPVEMTARNVVVHQTADPEVIVAEFEYAGRNTETGRDFVVPNIVVLRVRKGRIVESRDYAHHSVLEAALA
ncbi:nuclear transport factor 2 family protein [Actinomadura graeca]|uniref:Nuclear transport factor 2 family protein n=1 Tax=Actinomadura graeca TaxID=2750812 RepID=A0ABX8QRJ6_9ACTN|nr:nuclear transport factor 2 family protein [Actinomadura graeca]QXJ19463.1 nuclear transport factor 2 family protein [Actinomadura graeca]